MPSKPRMLTVLGLSMALCAAGLAASVPSYAADPPTFVQQVTAHKAAATIRP